MIRRLMLVAALGSASSAAALDLDAYASLLSAHTAEVEDLATVRVDYAGLVDSAEWAGLVESLAATGPPPPDRRDAHLAFWINAYNILAIDLVRAHYPVAGIKDIGSFLRPVWKRPAGRVGGREVTLDEVEHQILRPLGEPRIHAAIVCASASCPPLRREPYRAETLDSQLDDNTRVWLADPRKGSRVDGDDLEISPILDWFEEDFEASGGVLAFLARHGPEAVRARAARSPAPDLETFSYDWSLNDLATTRR